MTEVELIEASDRWIVAPMDEVTVTRCCVDYGFTLNLSGRSGSFEIRIEQPFELTLKPDVLHFDPSGDAERLGPALSVLHQTVVNITAFADGRLSIGFGSGAELRVQPSDEFEAWTLVGPESLQLVSIPGGDLAIWQPTRSKAN
jgi:hypothetical protein